MTYHDVFINRVEQFCLGIEQESGRTYVSMPLRPNGCLIEFDHYFELDAAAFERFQRDPQAALAFVERCRQGQVAPMVIGA
jgi:hypothetical protein